jgi:hypothetical protein
MFFQNEFTRINAIRDDEGESALITLGQLSDAMCGSLKIFGDVNVESIVKPDKETIRKAYNHEDFGGRTEIAMGFSSLKVTKIVESPAYDVSMFLAEVGGVLGLFVGMSVMTALEFVELLVVLFAPLFLFFSNKGEKAVGP